jgi:hypothetical protein
MLDLQMLDLRSDPPVARLFYDCGSSWNMGPRKASGDPRHFMTLPGISRRPMASLTGFEFGRWRKNDRLERNCGFRACRRCAA